MNTRRAFVVKGGVVVGATVGAGCLSDPAGDPEAEEPEDNGPEEDEERPPFSIDRFAFTSTRAEGHGEYTAQPDDRYEVGEMVWVYLEASNVSPDADEPQLDSQWTILAPDGTELAAIEEPISIPQATLGELPNEVYVTQGFDTGKLDVPEAGEYTLEVTLTDRESDQTASISRPFRLVQFEFERVVFTDGEPDGMDDYDPQPNDTYAVGDTIWLLVRVHHVPVDSAGTARLVYTFEIDAPDGSTWDVDDREEHWERVGEHHILAIWEAISTFEDDPPGEYELTLTVEDQVHGEAIRTTETFTLEQN
ncbi:hypothetical protein AArcCO_1299 [Halalkaliarchaeum sp. AArc-CO]|uniref:hypothetical protein n=1 Tax=unclassified Halalkaliarchaeum TaxID=2678344 RepID=UPI00217DD93B|nr:MULTISPECIES: hypothetical protein [unclassified Halalkaliarchaeum]MDR5673973.1 hypothetical protein [Halalkaliarchaeum sp. AArc-GB]UWG50609.1 hypothetical protein AArcCO_1299 [Halalkaliarchaeum sp. AArc-CO]